jgi:putative transposase
MKKIGIMAIYPKPKLSIVNVVHKKYPYLLRGLEINRINQVWATDITYIKLKGGFVYLTAIIDVFSRKILTWRISNTLAVDFCIESLNEAFVTYDVPEIFNTDQGSQFTSNEWIDILKAERVNISMDGKGRALDNIYIERLWRTVKYEDLYIKDYKNMEELKGGVNKYIKFYNEDRYHQSLGYKTPNEIYFQNKLKQIN